MALLETKKTIKILVSIFALFYPAELIILIASNAAVVDLFIATILFLGLVGAYMITYTGIEWDSPTINIINLLKSSGSQGLTENAIMKKLGHQTFVNNRLEQLISDGIVKSVTMFFIVIIVLV